MRADEQSSAIHGDDFGMLFEGALPSPPDIASAFGASHYVFCSIDDFAIDQLAVATNSPRASGPHSAQQSVPADHSACCFASKGVSPVA